MATETKFYRKANASSSEAITSLLKRFPKAEVLGFTQVKADAQQAELAQAKEGELVYEATIRMAEFPPAGGDDTPDDSAPESESAKPDFAPDESSETDESPDAEAGPEESKPEEKGEDSEGEGDGAKPKKLSPDEQQIHLLEQILHAIEGAGGPVGAGPGPGGPGGPGDLDLPDIGAPGQGDALPPPGGPGGVKPPLPPPVREKSPVGAGAFAHVVGASSEVTMIREDAHEVNNRQILDELREFVPTHTVARIQRTGTAVIKGETVNVPETKIAVVTLVRK